MALCNQILYMIEESPVDFASKPNLIAEVKVMRAWFYMNGIDLFGNIPFTDNFKDEDYHHKRPPILVPVD